MSKAKVNAVLKEMGLGNVKMLKDYSGFNTKTYKDWDGKMVKGIELRSHSPMDVTSVPIQQVAQRTAEISLKLHNSGAVLRKERDRFVIAENSKSITYVELTVRRFPTYTSSMRLDPGYQTSYLVPHFVKESYSVIKESK